jgi:hypothetical protein
MKWHSWAARTDRAWFELLALFGHGAMPNLSPLCASKRTSAFRSKSMASHPKRMIPASPRGFPDREQQAIRFGLTGADEQLPRSF